MIALSASPGFRLPAVPPVAAGALAGLFAVAMWAGYLSVSKAGVAAGLRPEDVMLLRFGVAGAVAAPWLLRAGFRDLGGVGWGRGAALAFFAGPVFVLLGVGGYLFAPLGHAAVIQPSALTLGALLLAAAFLGERLTRAKLTGAAVIVGGLLLIAAGSAAGAATPGAWRGDLLFAAAGLFWAGYTILLRRWGLAPAPATAAVSVLSAAVVVPAFFAFGDLSRLAALSPGFLAAQILVQGLGAGLLAVLAYGFAVRALGAGRAALFPAMVPGAALLLGWPVAGEVPGPLPLAGAALAMFGLLVAVGALRLSRR